jgi:hypothetical protein
MFSIIILSPAEELIASRATTQMESRLAVPGVLQSRTVTVRPSAAVRSAVRPRAACARLLLIVILLRRGGAYMYTSSLHQAACAERVRRDRRAYPPLYLEASLCTFSSKRSH